MKKVKLLSVASLLFAGCGVNDPLAITNSLRTACAAIGGTDDTIKTVLSQVEADKEAGNTYAQEIAKFNTLCTEPNIADQSGCGVCAVAIINQIYGR